MDEQTSRNYILEQLKNLVQIDSPTGYTENVQNYIVEELRSMGYAPEVLNKGGVVVCLGGEGHPLTVSAHADTLCAVVREVKSNGRLKISNINFHINSVETENVRVITRFDGIYEGTIQHINPSVHVNPDAMEKRDFNTNMEIVLDECVSSKKETEALGIRPGDVIALEPRFRITEKGFIKSRFLDDKASLSCLLGLAKAISTGALVPARKVYLLLSMFEELGHGGACGIPADTVEFIACDMGCVGEGLAGDERKASITAKDNSGIYNRIVTNNLIRAAEEVGADYVVDIYPSGSTDASVALRTGHDLRTGLVGPGVYASHGYERSHADGLYNTYALLCSYVSKDRFDEV